QLIDAVFVAVAREHYCGCLGVVAPTGTGDLPVAEASNDETGVLRLLEHLEVVLGVPIVPEYRERDSRCADEFFCRLVLGRQGEVSAVGLRGTGVRDEPHTCG